MIPGLAVSKQDQDMELVSLVREGDDAAFDALFRKYKQSIFNTCLAILGSREDAIDATQNTFIRAYKAIRSFRGEASFGTWLYRIARNVCLEMLRRRKTRPVSVPEIDVPESMPDCNEKVWEALLDLSPEVRSLLVLVYFRGLSGAEIAHALGCSEGAARTRLHRARQAFKERYEEVIK